MHILYTPSHHRHSPSIEIFNGESVPHSEVPIRVDHIVQALQKTAHTLTSHTEINLELCETVLREIHDEEYLQWFLTIQTQKSIYPSVFNATSAPMTAGSESIQWGNYVTDLFTPVLSGTAAAALAMADACRIAAEHLVNDGGNIAVVGRPPGHHAGRSKVGGYCYLNNAAVAAQVLSTQGTVAILDVDYHHSNGTQDIFYERADVVTCSIHADPIRKFPYFAGYASETGSGAGMDCNRNFPLPAQISNEQYQSVLLEAVEWIGTLNPNFLVVSLGLDTHESDPIADFCLTTEYYATMAETISQLTIPTVMVLEGGYSTSVIGANFASFVNGF